MVWNFIIINLKDEVFVKLFNNDIKLTKTEKVINDFIINNYNWFLKMNIIEASKAISVSPPMISKFSKKMGFKNFKDLQISVSRSITKHEIQKITHKDSTIKIIEKTLSMYIKYALDGVVQSKHDQAIRALTYLIDNSYDVFTYGLGSSKYAAENTSNKLRMLGKNAFTITRTHDIKLFGNKANKYKTIIIIYSFSGSGEEVKAMIKFAKENNIFFVLITTSNKYKDSNRSLVINFEYLDDDIQAISLFSPKITLLFISDIIIESYKALFTPREIEKFD